MGVLMLWSGLAQAKVKTEVVQYKEGEVVLEGTLSYDDAISKPAPGVVVIHDWMGAGAFSQKKAEDLAALGYVAFAADIYGKGVRPKDGNEAGALAGKFKGDRTKLRARARAALEALVKSGKVDPKRIGVMGFCFGGTTSLELARSGAEVAAVVSFHGGLDSPTPADGKNIRGRVLVLHGADDPFVKVEDLNAFKAELRSAKVDWQFVEYSGAVHAFTNPAAGNDNSKGAAYNALADRRSWLMMKSFFEEVLGPRS